MGGVDAGIWFPTMGLFIPDILDINLQYALCRAHNDWMANDFRDQQAPYLGYVHSAQT